MKSKEKERKNLCVLSDFVVNFFWLSFKLNLRMQSREPLCKSPEIAREAIDGNS
jgi:hypothetical protein